MTYTPLNYTAIPNAKGSATLQEESHPKYNVLMYNILEIDANVISVARVSSLYNLQPRTARTNLIQGQAQRPQRFLRCFIMLNYELRVSIYAALAYPKR